MIDRDPRIFKAHFRRFSVYACDSFYVGHCRTLTVATVAETISSYSFTDGGATQI